MASAPASIQFDHYRQNFVIRTADLTRKQYDDETTDLSANTDVYSLTIAPLECAEVGIPANQPKSSGSKMYLWLIKPDDVVCALEEGVTGQVTERKRLAHTNLCGANAAHCGGELWFRDGSAIWLTGGSSRFPPRDASELSMIVNAFRMSGYAVCSCGWDTENDIPARFFRGQHVWQEPI